MLCQLSCSFRAQCSVVERRHAVSAAVVDDGAQMYDGQHGRVPVDAGVRRSRDVVRVSRASSDALRHLRRRVLGGVARRQRQRPSTDHHTTRGPTAASPAQGRRPVCQQASSKIARHQVINDYGST